MVPGNKKRRSTNMKHNRERSRNDQVFHRLFNPAIASTALCLWMIEQSFAATGGSFYPSQLSSIGAANTSYGNTNGSSAGYSVFVPMTEALDLQAGQWPDSMASVYTSTDQPSFMEW